MTLKYHDKCAGDHSFLSSLSSFGSCNSPWCWQFTLTAGPVHIPMHAAMASLSTWKRLGFENVTG